MKNQHTPQNIGTQVRVAARSTSIVSALPIVLFAALITALAFTG